MTRLRLVLLLILLLPFSLLAQTTGQVTGIALDSLGNTVSGATITVCALGSSGIPCAPVTASTSSNGQGAFSVTVPVGTYTVTVFRSGVVATSSTVVVAPSNITVPNNIIGGTATFTTLVASVIDNTVVLQTLTDAGLTACLSSAGANGTCLIPANVAVPVSSSHSITAASETLRCEPGAVFNYTINGRIRMQGAGDQITGCTFNGVGPGTPINAQVVTMETANNQVFQGNTIQNFGVEGSGELDPFNGSGGLIANNTFINNADNDIFIQTSASTVMNDWRIVNNYGGVLVVHATNAGGGINHLVVSGNTFRAVENSKIEFCEEVGAFLGGNAPNDVTSTGNTCYLTASGGNGGFSFSTVNNCSENGDVFNANGFTATIASFEHVLLTNCTIQGTISVNGTGVNGLTCDRCNSSTFTGNVVNGFTTASNGYGFHLIVANTLLPNAKDNTFTGNVIIAPAAATGNAIWEQCNATGANCLNNTYTGNHVLGTGAGAGMTIEQDVGTVSNVMAENNHFTNLSQGINGIGTRSGIILVNNKFTTVTTDYSGSIVGDFIADFNQNFTGLSINQGTFWGTTNVTNLTGNRVYSWPDASMNVVGDTTTQALTNKTLNVPLTSGTGLQIFNTTTTCTTGAAVGSTCTTAAISLPVAEADTSYRVSCTGKGLTAVPVVIATANSSATQFTITIAALTAVAASFASYDCVAGHN